MATTPPDGEAARSDAVIASSLRWVGIAALLVRLIAMARGLFLARVLGPTPFGLFFGLTAISNIALLVAEFGLGSYVTHAASEARVKVPPVIAFALVTGLLGATSVVLFAPTLSATNTATVRQVALLLGLMVLIGPFGAVAQALLRVDMRFRGLALAQIVAELCATVAALGLVVADRRDLWVLAASTASANLVLVGTAIVMARPPRPSFGRLHLHAREAASFGAPLAAGSLLWAVAMQGDNVIVGRRLGATPLGHYGVAYNYGALPAGLLASTVGQVAFPVFSRARSEGRDVAAEFLRFSRLLAVVIVPVVVAAVFVADDAVRVILGDEWTDAVAPLRILLVAGGVRGLFPAEDLLRALGRVKVEFTIGLVAAPAILAAAVIGARDDIVLVASLVGVVLVVAALASTIVACRALSVGVVALWVAPIRVAAVAVVGALVGQLVGRSSDFAVVLVPVAVVLAVWAASAIGIIADLRGALSLLGIARRSDDAKTAR